MQSGKRQILWAAAFAGGVLIIMLVMSARSARPNQTQSVELEDGSVLTLERVQLAETARRRRAPVFSLLRHVIRRIVRAPDFDRRYYQDGALLIWVSRKAKATGDPLELDLGWAVAVDEHGCEFRARDWRVHGESFVGTPPMLAGAGPRNSKFLIYSGVLQTFPTRQKTFSLKLFNGRGELTATFDAPNPAGNSYGEWLPEPLPSSRTLPDGTVVTLLSVSNQIQVAQNRGARWNILQPVAVFEYARDGKPVNDWVLDRMKVVDATGRFTQSWNGGLCIKESAWRIEAEFRRQPHANFSSNEVWEITGLKAPAAGQSIQAGAMATLRPSPGAVPLEVQLCAVTGLGSVTYSNGIPISATAAPPRNAGLSLSLSSREFMSDDHSLVKVSSGLPHALIKLNQARDDVVLSVVSRDDVGQTGVAAGNHTLSAEYQLFQLKIATNATTLDLRVIAQARVKFDFMVPPPPAPKDFFASQ